jgi:DNA-binding YbaB/EbfC family protein
MNINNPFEILKNAQKIQEQFGGIQERLKTVCATGASGGGMVEIDLNGKLEVTAVRIAPETMPGGDAEMLQDLIMAAFTDGMAKVKESIGAEISGLGISGIPVAF